MYRSRSLRVVIAAACCFLPAKQGWSQTSVPTLASRSWSGGKSAPILSTPPTETQVTELVNYLQYSIVKGGGPFTVCSFRFVNLQNSGTLSLVATVNWASDYCNQIYIVDKGPGGFVISSLNGAKECCRDLGGVLQDLNGTGTYQLVVQSPLTFAQGLNHCGASWPVIYGWTGSEYADVSSQYMGFYRQRLANLRAQQASTFSAPCLNAEIAKLERFTGIDKTAGLSEAIKWAESNDPHQRIFAAQLLNDIGTPEAQADLKTLSHDTNRGVAGSAQVILAHRTGTGTKFAVTPVSVRTPPAGAATGIPGGQSPAPMETPN